MYARFFIENKETIGLLLIIFYAMLLVLAIVDLVLSKIQERKIARNRVKVENKKLEQQRKMLVSQQIRKVMTSEI